GTDGGTDGGYDGGTDGGSDGYTPTPAKGALTATATDFFFDVDSADLTASDTASLDAYAAAMAGGTDAITVDGYASTDGTAQRDNQLAIQRAQAVQKYLVSKGVDAKRIKTAGHGASDGFSKSDPAANRRVTVAPKPTPPKPLTLESETEATQPTNRKRT